MQNYQHRCLKVFLICLDHIPKHIDFECLNRFNFIVLGQGGRHSFNKIDFILY